MRSKDRSSEAARPLSATVTDASVDGATCPLTLRFFIARSSAQVLFFLRAETFPKSGPLSAQLDVTVQAVPPAIPTDDAALPASDQPIHHLTVPSFLVVKPSAADLHSTRSVHRFARLHLVSLWNRAVSLLGNSPSRARSTSAAILSSGRPSSDGAHRASYFPVFGADRDDSPRSDRIGPRCADASGSDSARSQRAVRWDVALFWLIEGFRLMESCATEQRSDVASPLRPLALLPMRRLSSGRACAAGESAGLCVRSTGGCDRAGTWCPSRESEIVARSAVAASTGFSVSGAAAGSVSRAAAQWESIPAQPAWTA